MRQPQRGQKAVVSDIQLTLYVDVGIRVLTPAW